MTLEFAHPSCALAPGYAETAKLVGLASKAVAPLWPLESPIAVNPLSGFEDLPFFDAAEAASDIFKARSCLPVSLWRRLTDNSKVDRAILAEVAVERLGGLNLAFEAVLPNINAHDILMARLLHLPSDDTEPKPLASPSRAELFVAKWCAAFLDQGLSAVEMPGREKGLYRATLDLIVHDPEFIALTGKRAKAVYHKAPMDPVTAIAQRLDSFGDNQLGKLALLRELLGRLPGWAGHIRWRSEYADQAYSVGAPATITDYLALWMLVLDFDTAMPVADSLPIQEYEGLASHFGIPVKAFVSLNGAAKTRLNYILGINGHQLSMMFMEAAERGFQAKIVQGLRNAERAPKVTPKRYDAQLIFCIDVRSEPLRRAIEQQGSYDTYGYAGFFGLPIAMRAPTDRIARRQLPVLLEPQHEVAQAVASSRLGSDSSLLASHARQSSASRLLNGAKRTMATSFAAAEGTGPIAGAMMLLRNLAPGIARQLTGPDDAGLSAQLSPCLSDVHSHGLGLEEKASYATGLFKLTGLVPETLAPLVLLVGHGATSTNNPFGGALECGACGGRAGGPNARVMAAILNDPNVRARLAEQNMTIPCDTRFVAGQHDTTTDNVMLFDCEQVPQSHCDALGKIAWDMAYASTRSREERGRKLNRSAADLMVGALHWGEVRPEWGLSGNAAFIAGPRSLTQEIDLDGRVFLHSYDWRTDSDGGALKTILTAPMVVAQWINCQYLFSTIDNNVYGAGDKTVHNVLGGFGVVRGNGGDLCVGLPRQSLFCDDGTPHHVPQRLLTIVQAPLDRVDAIILEDALLGRLFGNGWVKLVVIDPTNGRVSRWTAGDELIRFSDAPGGWAEPRTIV